jgi:hypothetical protein
MIQPKNSLVLQQSHHIDFLESGRERCVRRSHFDFRLMKRRVGLVCRALPHSDFGDREGTELAPSGGISRGLSKRSAEAILDLHGTYLLHLLTSLVGCLYSPIK